MVATATLVDARTGAAIITYPDLVAQVVVGQGIVGTAVQAAIDSAMPQTTTERLIAEYGRSYRTWLVRPA
jgi:pectin methylesterase-like acyl-CoA thioesterase